MASYTLTAALATFGRTPAECPACRVAQEKAVADVNAAAAAGDEYVSELLELVLEATCEVCWDAHLAELKASGEPLF